MDYTKTKVEDVVVKFFKEHPDEEIEIAYAEKKIRNAYLTATGKSIRDPARIVRLLFETGFVERPRKGIYKYNPLTSSHKTHRETIKNAKDKKPVSFNGKTVKQCLATAKANGDVNAVKCFKTIIATMKKHGIDTYQG